MKHLSEMTFEEIREMGSKPTDPKVKDLFQIAGPYFAYEMDMLRKELLPNAGRYVIVRWQEKKRKAIMLCLNQEESHKARERARQAKNKLCNGKTPLIKAKKG